jgi:hypothetical protein
MSCPEEFGRLDDELRRLIRKAIVFCKASHECEVHKVVATCSEADRVATELSETFKALSDAITDLSRCIERAVRR